MNRFADLFITTCIIVVAIAAAVVLRFQAGFGWETALVGGISMLAVLTIVNIQGNGRRDRDRLAAEVAGLTLRLGELGQDVANLQRRVGGLEQNQGRRQNQDVEAVVAEVEVIGALVRQVVESVADMETRVLSHQVRTGAAGSRPAPAAAAQPKPAPPPAPVVEEPPLLPRRFAHLGEAGFLDLVRRAIEANRIDIHLQPIVTLPQRRIRYYEALTRLRTEDGDTIYPSDYIPLAEASGIMPMLDNQILFRTVQILRRLVTRTKDIGLFCNISMASLGDTAFFREFVAFLEANRALSDTLVFEFTQRQIKSMNPIEYEALRSLQSTGFRFSVDQVSDLRPSFQLMAERGFKFAKIGAERILNRMDELGADIHPADLANFFARFGIDLIVDRVESETQVVELLDFGVRYGQGFVFSPPRPVRSDVLQSTIDPPAAEPVPTVAPTATMATPGMTPPTAPPPSRMEAPARMEPPARADRQKPAAEPRRNALGRAIAQKT